VKPPLFEYRHVDSVDEALSLLAQEKDQVKVLAGGQSLVPMMNLRLGNPEMLMDVGALPLRSVHVSDDKVRIGSLVTHRVLETNDTVAQELPLVTLAARHIGHVAIRNRGTIGGSIAHADPAAELIVAALALEGEVVVRSVRGTRVIRIENLLRGPFMTTLEADELITAIDLPRHGDCGAAFEEIAIRAGDFAVAACGAVCRMTEDGVLTMVRIALGGVSPTAIRVSGAEERLQGVAPSSADLHEAALSAAAAASPGTDVHASAEYRRGVVVALVERALQKAMNGGQP
jgi:aerobic carbon-monoxide dehydrogenase medium subunit